MRTLYALLCVSAFALPALASSGASTDVNARARGAKKIVVATVTDVQSRFDVSPFGDELIVSDLLVRVDDTLKGTAVPSLTVAVEGGTVGELTLNVSDMPALKRGERAVFFLDETAAGKHVPRQRGAGVLKIDGSGRVREMDLTLAEAKAKIRAALK